MPTMIRTSGIFMKYFNSFHVDVFFSAGFSRISGMKTCKLIRQSIARTAKKINGMRYPNVSATSPPARGPNIMPMTIDAWK